MSINDPSIHLAIEALAPLLRDRQRDATSTTSQLAEQMATLRERLFDMEGQITTEGQAELSLPGLVRLCAKTGEAEDGGLVWVAAVSLRAVYDDFGPDAVRTALPPDEGEPHPAFASGEAVRSIGFFADKVAVLLGTQHLRRSLDPMQTLRNPVGMAWSCQRWFCRAEDEVLPEPRPHPHELRVYRAGEVEAIRLLQDGRVDAVRHILASNRRQVDRWEAEWGMRPLVSSGTPPMRAAYSMWFTQAARYYATSRCLRLWEQYGLLPEVEELGGRADLAFPDGGRPKEKMRGRFWALYDLVVAGKRWDVAKEMWEDVARSLGVRGPEALRKEGDAIRKAFSNRALYTEDDTLYGFCRRVREIGEPYDDATSWASVDLNV